MLTRRTPKWFSAWNDLGFEDFARSFGSLDALERQMDGLFCDFERDVGIVGGRADAAWPRIGLTDSGNAFVMRAEVPGLEDKDLEITVNQDSVTVRGERKEEALEGYAVQRRERGTMRFAKSYTLPCKVDSERAEASLKNGILTLTLPKAIEAQPKRVTVKSG